MKRKLKIGLIIKLIISVFFIVLSCYLYSRIKTMDIIPNKYLRLIILVLILINILGTALLFIKGIVTKIISGIIYIVLLLVCIVGIRYSNLTIKFLNSAFEIRKEYIPYSFIVLKDKYKTINDVKNKNIGYLTVDNKDYIEQIKKEVPGEYSEHDLFGIYDGLKNGSIDVAVLGTHYLDLMQENYSDFNDIIESIYKYNVEIVLNTAPRKVSKLEPINIYLSGLDNRSDKVEATGLSDVNMIITINPQTKTILLTSIPRDYYVQFHGIDGIKDKLTHSGTYGIEMGKTTLEDLFNIKIDYTIKVGFVSVVNIVDLVGGVDIYSDQSFKSSHYKGWYVQYGMNHMDGAHALAYARERYAYRSGDDHRILNQQQVFEAVFNKIITNKTFLYRYDTLLNELSNLYITDIPKDYVTLLIKSQINDMKSWNLVKQTVGGYNSFNYCYTMPGWWLYVEEPEMETVYAAKDKIEKVLNGEI